MHRHQDETAPLVEAKSSQIVVGRDQPHPPATGGPGRLHDGREQGRPDSLSLRQTVQRDDLAFLTFDVVRHQPQRPAAGIGGKARQPVCLVNPPAGGDLGRLPALFQESPNPLAVIGS